MTTGLKNLPLQGVMSQLQLGDTLKQQLDDELANRRKIAQGGDTANASPLSSVMLSLFRGQGGYGVS